MGDKDSALLTPTLPQHTRDFRRAIVMERSPDSSCGQRLRNKAVAKIPWTGGRSEGEGGINISTSPAL